MHVLGIIHDKDYEHVVKERLEWFKVLNDYFPDEVILLDPSKFVNPKVLNKLEDYARFVEFSLWPRDYWFCSSNYCFEEPLSIGGTNVFNGDIIVVPNYCLKYSNLYKKYFNKVYWVDPEFLLPPGHIDTSITLLPDGTLVYDKNYHSKLRTNYDNVEGIKCIKEGFPLNIIFIEDTAFVFKGAENVISLLKQHGFEIANLPKIQENARLWGSIRCATNEIKKEGDLELIVKHYFPIKGKFNN